MKLKRNKQTPDNPAVKGNLTVEEIVKTDWQRDYERQGVPLNAVRSIVKKHVDDGGQVVRLRNTLILLTMEKGDEEARFAIITADIHDVYLTMLQLFALSITKSRGVETLYTYVNDKAPFRIMAKLFGEKNVDFEETDNPEYGKYKITIDAGQYYQAGQKLPATNMRS